MTKIRAKFDSQNVNNVILRSIPAEEFQLIAPHLEHVMLSVGHTLHDPDEGVSNLYFLNSGIASLLVDTDSGKSVEVGIAGREGMTGVSVVAGLGRTIHRAAIRVAGDGFRIGVLALGKILASAPVLEQRAHLFAAIQSMQIAQTAACNRLHDVGQRMARWLLMTSDRVDSKMLSVTHDFLSTMLGTDRPSVTENAVSLQARGVIEYARGKLRIRDRRKLESDACECYRALRQFNRELGLA